MCGIAGICYHDHREKVSKNEIEALTTSLVHRGPDEDGFFLHQNIGLGHKRLSIIDLASGKQPMSYGHEKLVIVYNGEIYNHPELRSELKKSGQNFHTNSDTEVILAAYAEWGPSCVKKFNGMWSFVIYDYRQEPGIFCSRDRMGIKPFYYLNENGRFAFASELKAFTRLSEFRYSPDNSVLWDHLVFGPKNGGATYWQGIMELAPGCNLFVKEGRIKTECYFDLGETFSDQSNKPNPEDLSELVQSSIRLRLRSDVPLATINSGGLDSSIISAIASNHVNDLRTFCIAPVKNSGAKEHVSDESRFADVLAAHISSKHENIRYSSQDFIEHLDDSIFANDGELYHSNSVLMNILFHQIKSRGITVVLGGEGADEVFGGYFSNRLMNAVKFMGRFGGSKVIFSKYKSLRSLNFLSKDIRRLIPFIRSGSLSPDRANKVLGITGEMHEDRRELIKYMNTLSPQNALSYYEQKIYLAGLLRRADRMSMANGIELRVPFLDHRLVEHMNGISYAKKCGVSKKSEKKLLKQVGTKYVPDLIINRPKLGFGSALDLYETLLQQRLQKEAGFNGNSLNLKELWSVNSIVQKEHLNQILSRPANHEY